MQTCIYSYSNKINVSTANTSKSVSPLSTGSLLHPLDQFRSQASYLHTCGDVLAMNNNAKDGAARDQGVAVVSGEHVPSSVFRAFLVSCCAAAKQNVHTPMGVGWLLIFGDLSIRRCLHGHTQSTDSVSPSSSWPCSWQAGRRADGPTDGRYLQQQY